MKTIKHIVFALVALTILTGIGACSYYGKQVQAWEDKAVKCKHSVQQYLPEYDDEGCKPWQFRDNCTECHDQSYAAPLYPIIHGNTGAQGPNN